MKVRLKNVGVIDSCDVEFIPGINIIVGSSGSGKSTLLRSIHNIAVNEFSDSDISFGKESMNISIVTDGNTIEYSRFAKSKGDKFYYVVNGEKYSKVGRQSLAAVNDILKLGDIDINGDSINFNFNMQFSTPFLIFGSQSTLYNVLTYRSQFDISKINDCYNSDVKANNNEINTTLKVIERLNDSVSELEAQERKLKPVENIYSDYMLYKHNKSNTEELNSLFSKLNDLENLESYLKQIADLINDTQTMIADLELLNNLQLCKNCFIDIARLNTFITEVSSLECDYRLSDSLSSTLNDIILLNNKMIECNNKSGACNDLQMVLDQTSIAINKANFIDDITDCYDKMISKSFIDNEIKILSNIECSDISNIEGAISIYYSMSTMMSVCSEIDLITNRLNSIDSELSSFNMCPLCGSCLH